MEMGMDIDAKRKCPCPLWGQDFCPMVENPGDKTMFALAKQVQTFVSQFIIKN